jgi:DNA-directed RNA polymerase subunit RPC12/RpoP
MEITTSFKCSKCGIEFIQNEGGICSSCKRLFCLSHLSILREDKTTKLICTDCNKRIVQEKKKRV